MFAEPPAGQRLRYGQPRVGPRADAGLARATIPFAILDSGGYELNELGKAERPARAGWGPSVHADFAARWRPPFPGIVVSYDDPQEGEVGLPIQVERAQRLFSSLPGAGSCMLVRSPRAKHHLTVADVRPLVGALGGFDVIGVTENDVGSSMTDRLRFVRDLRLMLDERGLDLPIHVFGGLDPFLAPLYMVAGADVFDGLGWLRYGFLDGSSVNMQGAVARTRPDVGFDDGAWAVGRANLRYLADLQVAMQRVALGAPLEEFGPSVGHIFEVYERTFSGTV